MSVANRTVDDALERPAISVVVVTPARFANVRRTLRHLRAQTVQGRIELVLVAPDRASIADAAPYELRGFHSAVIVEAGPISDVEKAAALGIHRAGADIVGLVEDHAFAEPEWAEAMIAAHEGPWVAVASTIVNANPRRTLSWSNLLVAYGASVEPVQEGERSAIPGHNLSYKRAALAAFGDTLRDRLGREGGLLDALRANGGRFLLSAQARVHHINPSTLAATTEVRVNGGRLYAARRAAGAGWNPLKRALYVLGGPLIPFVRYSRVTRELFGDGRRSELARRTAPAIFAGLVLDAAGQMLGYAFGEGRSRSVLTHFELDRMLHIPSSERALFEELEAPASEDSAPAPPGLRA